MVFATIVEYERHLAELEENIRIVHVNIFAHELVKLKEIKTRQRLEIMKKLIWVEFVPESLWVDLGIHCPQEAGVSKPW